MSPQILSLIVFAENIHLNLNRPTKIAVCAPGFRESSFLNILKDICYCCMTLARTTEQVNLSRKTVGCDQALSGAGPANFGKPVRGALNLAYRLT